MKNPIYKTRNDLTMVEAGVFNWQRESKYYGKEEPYTYSIYVGSMADGHYCLYHDDKTLSIAYSGEEGGPTLIFKVSSIEEASDIVKKFSDGMEIDLSGTIYDPKELSLRKEVKR